ncbi:MAG: LacI family DNA-binding transcriptional regulator [Bauldia sp.]
MIPPIKLKDVAKAAGVSQGTASNAFNRPELVRPEVRERVAAAASRLGYAGPDPRGRLLRDGKFHAIGVVPPGAFGLSIMFSGGYTADFLAGIAEVCDEMGAALTLVSGRDQEKAQGIRNALVDGFILNRIEDLDLVDPARRRGLAVVVMDEDGDSNTNSVRLDDRDGARQAAQHLVGLGHRRFAILSVMREDRHESIFHAPGEPHHRLLTGFTHDRDRLSGYGEVLAEAGISLDEVPIIEGYVSPKGAFAGAAMLFDRAPETTAVLTMSDGLALAVLDEAHQRSISVPRDLSVVGFDDWAAAARADPPLTTVFQPVVEKGRAAARILFEGGPPRHVVLPLRLVVRSSTAPPREEGTRPAMRRKPRRP